MNGDFIEDWETFPEDWYDCVDDTLRRSHIMLLESCFRSKDACKGINQKSN